MKSKLLFILALAVAGALAVNSAVAKDDPLEFLHLMQREGFPDIAIDYLENLKDDPSAPPEIMRVWDLEMSKSKREFAKFAYNDAQRKQLTDESKALMEKFVKDNPDLPEAIQAAADWAAEMAIEAQYDVLRAAYLTDKTEKAAMLAKARKIFEDVRPRFVQSRDSAAKVLAAMTNKTSQKQRDSGLFQSGENRLKLAMVDFYLALTEPAETQRAAEFGKVAAEFDKIYQDFREYFLGWEAHYWNARIMQELSKNQDAKDIYDEVMAHDETDVPDSSTAGAASPATLRAMRKNDPGMEDYFFAEVEQHLLQTTFVLTKADYLDEVTHFRKSHKNISEKCAGYQGLSLDYVRHELDWAKEAKDEAAKKTHDHEALRVLMEMTKINSPYQRDAMELLRQLSPKATPEDSFDFAVIDADAALEKKDWVGAAELYSKALESATPKTDKQKLALVRNAYMGCIHNQAAQLYQKGKVNEAVDLIVSTLKKPNMIDTPTAPAAAAAALSWRFYQYQLAPKSTDDEKTAAEALRTKTIELANAIIKIRSWTAKEEADSARVDLLHLALERADVESADKIFKEINPESREYSTALTALGYEHWRRYREAKKKWEEANSKEPPDKKTQAQLDDDRGQALDYTKKAVEALARVPRSKGTPMPKELRSSSDFLADMYAEGGDFKSAVVLYQSLIDDILADAATKSLDDLTLRIFNGAVQAYLQLNDMAKASVIAAKILELGSDQAAVNMAIINFAKRLEMARKQAAGENDANGEKAAQQQAIVDLEAKIMIDLAKREKLSPTTMVWIVKTLSLLNRDDADDAATKLVDKLTDLWNNDPKIEEELRKAIPGLRSLASNLRAKHGEYDKAVDLINGVIEAYPKALEPQMMRAQIYTKWAAKDAEKYPDAISAWYKLSSKLERAKTKSGEKMPEYYDAVYNEYLCFYKMAEKNNDKELARKAFDLINPLLQFDPKLQGPDRDRELSVKFYQLGGKLADILGETRPTPPSNRPAPKK